VCRASVLPTVLHRAADTTTAVRGSCYTQVTDTVKPGATLTVTLSWFPDPMLMVTPEGAVQL
jgi:hypothetical protein